MDSKPRAWEGDAKICVGDGVAPHYVTCDKILVECDRRDVLLRWTVEARAATHYTDEDEGAIFWGGADNPAPWYIATPVADLVQSEAEKAV